MILHVIEAGDWREAQTAGAVAAPGGGFLHCCTEAQLGFVLRRHFAGRRGLLVLEIDDARLPAPPRWEESEPGQPPFPHVYGPIPVAAVAATRAVPDAG